MTCCRSCRRRRSSCTAPATATRTSRRGDTSPSASRTRCSSSSPGEDHIAFVDPDQILDEVEEFLTGAKPARVAERVLATVLFTDLVGSTELARELGDRRWAELLERHDDAVRRELARFGGEEIDTAGDGFFALFDGPTSAIRCALAARDDVRALGLEPRRGIHTGEVERPRGGSLAGSR